MFLPALTNICALHGGIPIALSQLTLNVMLVVLALAIMGIGFGRLAKSKESLRQHRWTLTTAIILALVTIFFVMTPSFFVFYIDPDVQVFGSLSITTLIHSGLAVPAIISAIVYAFGDLPVNVRKWMRLIAALWIAATVIGVVLFLQMVSLI